MVATDSLTKVIRSRIAEPDRFRLSAWRLRERSGVLPALSATIFYNIAASNYDQYGICRWTEACSFAIYALDRYEGLDGPRNKARLYDADL